MNNNGHGSLLLEESKEIKCVHPMMCAVERASERTSSQKKKEVRRRERGIFISYN